MFEVGDRVYFLRDRGFAVTGEEPKITHGTITEISETGVITVEWDNGFKPSPAARPYTAEDLVRVVYK